ncbi:MAG: peptidoglycan DD-metalloendopeptidase family protein [Crocinitomicaceae bacterium]|nr:peptidoglycan DD-metalloendopeptidase family protein [Crocinitomicaceae bacterium]
MNKIQGLLIAILFLLSAPLFGQNKSSATLKKEQEKLAKKILFTKKLLGDTKNLSETTTKELGIISRQISYRQELINNVNEQITDINKLIMEYNSVIQSMQNDIAQLKDQYREMIQYAYKNRNEYNELMFIFSADNFNEAFKRIKYLNKIKEFRKNQIVLIQKAEEKLKEKIVQLEDKKVEKQALISMQDQEKLNFEKDKQIRNQTLQKLKQEESKLLSQLQQQEKEKRDLAKAIQKAIEMELSKSNATKTTAGFKPTKEMLLTGQSFYGNKGKLPWPVEKGEITEKFGKNPHPVHANVFTYNNGVDISTVSGSNVRAIYEGEVSSVLVIPGAGKVIIIAHGSYRTVYSNLKETYVKKGDKVKTKQLIGSLLPDGTGKRSEAHFEIRQITPEGIKNLNPAYWLGN